MLRKPVKRDILTEFREDRGQSATPPKQESAPARVSDAYQSFLVKFKYFSADVCEKFGTRDIVYYFREIARENGVNYMIANMQKDMAIVKRLRQNYTNVEICAMIEFLFTSEQDYLDKARLTLNVLASNWVNTIYPDTQLWIEDKYVPRSVAKESKRTKSQHEWHSDESDTTKIGVKL